MGEQGDRCPSTDHLASKEGQEGRNDTIKELTVVGRATTDEQTSEPELFIGLSNEDMKQAQVQDGDLCWIRERIEAGLAAPSRDEVSPTSPTIKYWCARWRQLAIKQGILQYGWEPERPGRSIIWKVIIPDSLKGQVMRHLHDAKAGGHLGITKTWEKAKQCRFIWSHMRTDIVRWVQRCRMCQRKKAPPFKKRAHLVRYQVGAPWERIAADVAGPFPTTSKGHKYILVVQDYFTKWVEIFPMGDQTA